MIMDATKTKSEQYFLSDEAIDRIFELTEQYGLTDKETEIMTEIDKTSDISVKRDLFETLPVRQMAKIVKGLASREIPESELISTIEAGTGLEGAIASALAHELKELIPLTEKVTEELQPQVIKEPKEERKIPPETIRPIQKESSLSEPQSSDTYREPV